MQPTTVVRLRQDLPRGTVVEELDENTVLVEFADEEGKAMALLPVPKVLLTQVMRLDDAAAAGYPVDVEWENMPEVGLERWPYVDQEKNGN